MIYYVVNFPKLRSGAEIQAQFSLVGTFFYRNAEPKNDQNSSNVVNVNSLCRPRRESEYRDKEMVLFTCLLMARTKESQLWTYLKYVEMLTIINKFMLKNIFVSYFSSGYSCYHSQ